MPQYAKFESRSAWLGQSFGEGYARRLFGDAVVDSLPRCTRGKNTGKIQAEIAWVKCLEGGWIRAGRDRDHPVGRVERRVGKVVFAVLRSRDEEGFIATHGDIEYCQMLSN